MRGAITMKKKLMVDGMTWGACLRRVRAALENVDGVKVEDIKIGEAVVSMADSVSIDELNDAVYDAGYDVVGSEDM